jgi:hypothetical protein
MIDKQYTVEEIDRMRSAVRYIIFPDGHFSDDFPIEERYVQKQTEDQLRTYMINGTRPEELEELVSDKEEWLRWRNKERQKCWDTAPPDSTVKYPEEIQGNWRPGRKAT